MGYKVKLEQFEGPLDLLLEIVEAKKFNVLTLSLSKLAEQFLMYLSQIPEKNMNEIASFIAVGARLALLKSRELVPSLFSEEENDELNLKRQLSLYYPYRMAAKKLEKLVKRGTRYYSRDAFQSHPPVFTFPEGLTANILEERIKDVTGTLASVQNIPQARIKDTISLEECINHLKRVVKGKEQLDFTNYLKERDKEEHVVHFVGLLELMRSGHVIAHQKVAFGTIEVRTYGGN